MQSWILIVAAAQLLYAVATIVDKYILTSKKVSKPFVYAFYVNILSIIPITLFFLSPFNLKIGSYALPVLSNVARPTASLIAMALLSAYTGFYALLSLYTALKKADASDVTPVVGSISAIGTFALSFLFISDTLSPNFFLGFIFFVAGTAFVSHFRFTKEVFLLVLHAGFLYSIKAVMMKEMFSMFGFD